MPSRHRILRRWGKCSNRRRSWGLFGTTPKQSRPTAKHRLISCLDTISQPLGSAMQHFFRAGQSGPRGPKSRDSPRCDAASPSIGSKGLVYHVPSLEAALAEAEASAGEMDVGLRRLDDALDELERTEERWY